ncbi:MAG TPA: maleylpyruvate isomerase N-terminal domain-containing protein [Acidimicrobiia bacterium]
MTTAAPTDQTAARRALVAAAGRSAGLLRAAGDGRLRVERSEWTVGEVGAHLVMGFRANRSVLEGRTDVVPSDFPAGSNFAQRLAAVTSAMLSVEPERDPAVLADLLAAEAARFLATSAGHPAEERLPTPWYGDDSSLSLAAVTCLLLGEQLIHGRDLALTLRRPWPISADDAKLLAGAYPSMLPLAIDPGAAAGADLTCEIRLRDGGARFVVRIRDATVEIEGSDARRVDCHLSADPVAFALVAYGRVSQWDAIARGQLMAWGRKPWKALTFRQLFFNP